MNILELNSSKDGYKHFKVVLHEIYPEDTFDDVQQIAMKTNRNGIAWRRKWVEQHLDSIKDTSIRVEFMDEYDKTEILGHGETGYGADNLPEFENAEVIGHFTNGYIDEIDDGSGKITVCIGEGYIDSMCNPKFVEALENQFSSGETICGSVEIIKPLGKDSIIYQYPPTAEMRIPMDYAYSGYAFLSVRPADEKAVLLELNSDKKEETAMNENDIKTIVEQTVSAMNNSTSEINQAKVDCEARIAEANAQIEQIVAEKEALVADSLAKTDELEACRRELEEAKKVIDELRAENECVQKELSEARAKEKINDLAAAISPFTDEEKGYAAEEIEAFKNDPMAGDINAIVNKIYGTIGKNAKANAEAMASEINSSNDSIEDIFGEVSFGDANDTDIFA